MKKTKQNLKQKQKSKQTPKPEKINIKALMSNDLRYKKYVSIN